MPINNLNLTLSAYDLLHADGSPGLENFMAAGGRDVINLIRIPGEQQVMLRVTVAEIDRTAARTIGINFNLINKAGTTVFGQQTGGITVSGNVLSQTQSTTGGVLANVPLILDNGQVPVAIEALKTLNYARSLAEPTLTAMNGQTASFQAGGSFPVPVLGGVGSGSGVAPLSGVQFVPYGVR